MANIPIIEQNIDEVYFFINYLTNNISKFNLNELTNGAVGDLPNIIGAHPLAIEYGNMLSSEDENYTSILPCIGVEMLDDNDGQSYLGSGPKTFEMSQSYIDNMSAIQLKDRFNNGIVLSDTNLDSIQAAKTAKGSEKLWVESFKYMMDQNINISIWSDNWDITRIVYVVLRDLMHRLKHELSKNGVKNAQLSGQGALYNYDFNTTLFGSELNLRFINNHRTVDVDSSIVTISKVNESKEGVTGVSKPEFKGIGE